MNRSSYLRSTSLLVTLFVSQAFAAFADDWWKLADADFVSQYKQLASGTQKEQSRFAWMLFARLNQPVKHGDQTVSQWELWPSNDNTFGPDSPQGPQFLLAQKVRIRPHLQLPKGVKTDKRLKMLDLLNPFATGGEEVTRNPIAYGYIKDAQRPLSSMPNVWKALKSHNPIVDLPVASIETKVRWNSKIDPGMYQIDDGGRMLGVAGQHIMVKVAPLAGSNPTTSTAVNWFWTTFEFKKNPGRDAALKFITYPDALDASEVTALLTEAGLNKEPWTNYACNGTQIHFVDPNTNGPVVLGNTTMEGTFVEPDNAAPDHWTKWNSSCHTCHAQASGHPGATNQVDYFNFDPQIGPVSGVPNNYSRFDFIWSIPFNAH